MKIKFVIDNKYISDSFKIKELINIDENHIIENVVNKYEPCDCQFNESCNHCECYSGNFDNSEITEMLHVFELTDKNDKELFEKCICNYKHLKNGIIKYYNEINYFILEFENCAYNLSFLAKTNELKNIEIIGNLIENK